MEPSSLCLAVWLSFVLRLFGLFVFWVMFEIIVFCFIYLLIFLCSVVSFSLFDLCVSFFRGEEGEVIFFRFFL